MAFSASSFFAGVATVIATVAIGFGGGVLMTDALVGNGEKAPTLAERRAAETPQPQPAVALQEVGARAVVVSSPAARPNPTPAPAGAAAQKPHGAEQAFAKASEPDLKKAAAAERRKAQRRAERRRQRAEQRQLAEQARERSNRPFTAESPRINLFGND